MRNFLLVAVWALLIPKAIGAGLLSETEITAHWQQHSLSITFEVDHPRGVSFSEGVLTVSSRFEWYAEDFDGNDQQILSHMRHFADPALKELPGTRKFIDRYQYEWSLNEDQ